MARGLLGDQCPMQFRHGRSQALKEADLVIICGMPCDFRLNYGRSIRKHAFYIAVSRCKADLRLNRKPDLAVLADPCTLLLKLTSDIQFDRRQFGSLGRSSESTGIGRRKKNHAPYGRANRLRQSPSSVCANQ
ncbi:MAG: hypothetical protein R2861_14855 [Desulfobacterales bacterium]